MNIIVCYAESDAPNSASYYTGNDSGGECGVVSTKLLTMPSPATTNEPWYPCRILFFWNYTPSN